MDPFEPRPPRPYPVPAVVPPATTRDRAARVADIAPRQVFPPPSTATPAALHHFDMAAATANPFGVPLSARVPALALASGGPPTPAFFAPGSASSTMIPTALRPRAIMADVLSTVGTTPSTIATLDQTTAALVAAASLHASSSAASAAAVRSDPTSLAFTAQPTTSDRHPPHDVPMGMPPFMPASGAPAVDVDPVLLHATVTAVMVAAAALNGGDPASTLSSPAITGSLNASPDASSMYDAGYSSTGFHPAAAAVASPFPLAALGPADVEVATVAAMAAAMISASGVLPFESPVDTEPVPLDLQLPPAPLPMGTPSTLWPASTATETVPLTSSTWDMPTSSEFSRDSGLIPSLWSVPGSDATVASAPPFTTFTPPGTPLALGLHGSNASSYSAAPARSGLGPAPRHGTASGAMPRPTAFGPGSAFSTAAAASRSTTSLFPSMTTAATPPSAWAQRTDPAPAAQFGPGTTFSTATSTSTMHPATAMGVLSCAPVPPPVSSAMPHAFAAGPVAFRAPDVATSIFMPPPPPPVVTRGARSLESSGPMGSGSADARVSPLVPPPPTPTARGGRGKGRARTRGSGGVRSTPETRRKARKDPSSSSSSAAESAGDASPATTAADDWPKVFQCPVCDKTFTRAFNLKSHVMTHSNDRPFACRYCDRTFARKHDCERHQRLHTGDRPYRCGACGIGFPRHDALARHLRSEPECAKVFQMVPRRPSVSAVTVAVPPAASEMDKDADEDLSDGTSRAAEGESEELVSDLVDEDEDEDDDDDEMVWE
ncbi:hypothetical protein GGF32_005504 [Allomyces javanicus]|nr:hypothetical protein GGF32_005504 [Allomyces javanicus]